jgi:hypothetical protein
MRIRLVLVIILLGIIFPIHWIGHLSTTTDKVMDVLIGPEWIKIILHIASYAGLVALLVIATRLPPRWYSVLIISGLILVIAVLQEFVQWLTRDEEISAIIALRRSAFDLGIDFLGGLLGAAGIFWVSWKSGWGQPLSKHK